LAPTTPMPPRPAVPDKRGNITSEDGVSARARSPVLLQAAAAATAPVEPVTKPDSLVKTKVVLRKSQLRGKLRAELLPEVCLTPLLEEEVLSGRGPKPV